MKPRAFQKLQTNGVSLRAVVEGDGPLCILVHGWPESWYSWRHQIDPLVAAGYRVCVPDVRGYGGSDKPEAVEAYDMRQMTGDIAGLVDALGEKQAILIGHDWGAPIVWSTSVLHPQKVQAVVGLSVPYLGRGPMAPIDLFRLLYKDRFFYQNLLPGAWRGRARARGRRANGPPEGVLRRLGRGVGDRSASPPSEAVEREAPRRASGFRPRCRPGSPRRISTTTSASSSEAAFAAR